MTEQRHEPVQSLGVVRLSGLPAVCMPEDLPHDALILRLGDPECGPTPVAAALCQHHGALRVGSEGAPDLAIEKQIDGRAVRRTRKGLGHAIVKRALRVLTRQHHGFSGEQTVGQRLRRQGNADLAGSAHVGDERQQQRYAVRDETGAHSILTVLRTLAKAGAMTAARSGQWRAKTAS
jgi:hypothetical protein